MLSLVTWSSLVPPIPILILALRMDSPDVLLRAVANLYPVSGFSVFYLAFFSTLFGYGTWSAVQWLGRLVILSVPPTPQF